MLWFITKALLQNMKSNGNYPGITICFTWHPFRDMILNQKYRPGMPRKPGNSNRMNKQYILKEALKHGLCQPWAEQMAQFTTADQMMDMYVRGIDFCFSTGFPSNEVLVQEAGSVMNNYGVYVDTDVQLCNASFSVLLGKSLSVLRLTGYNVGELYLKDSTVCTVEAADNSYLTIDCFDKSKLDIHSSGSAQVRVNIYGSASCNYSSTGTSSVKIVHKHKATY